MYLMHLFTKEFQTRSKEIGRRKLGDGEINFSILSFMCPSWRSEFAERSEFAAERSVFAAKRSELAAQRSELAAQHSEFAAERSV